MSSVRLRSRSAARVSTSDRSAGDIRGHGPVVEGGPGGTDGAVDVGVDGDRHLTDDRLGGGRDDAHPLVSGGRRPPAPDEEFAAVHQAIVHGCEGNR